MVSRGGSGSEARPEKKGHVTQTAAPSACASRTLILNQVFTGHLKSTRSTQIKHWDKMNTKNSQPFLRSAHTRSLHVWVKQHHLSTVTPTSHLRSHSSRSTFCTIPVVCSAAMASPLTPYHANGST